MVFRPQYWVSWQWWAQLLTVHLMLWLGVQAQPPLVQSLVMIHSSRIKNFYLRTEQTLRPAVRDGELFRLPARRAFDSVALVCAAAEKLCIAFPKGKFFTGGRAGPPGFEPGMNAVALINGHKP